MLHYNFEIYYPMYNKNWEWSYLFGLKSIKFEFEFEFEQDLHLLDVDDLRYNMLWFHHEFKLDRVKGRKHRLNPGLAEVVVDKLGLLPGHGYL